MIYCTTVGGDPTNLRVNLYNSAGTTILATRSTDYLVNALGAVKIPFDSKVLLTADTLYWIGVWGDASNSVFLFSNSSVNNQANNNLSASSSIGYSVPALATASRLVGSLY
jgi:hypothetical protein